MHFLLSITKGIVSKKKEYQILYFPMTAPLTDQEKMQMKEVISIKIS